MVAEIPEKEIGKKEFTFEDAMKMLYTLLNTVGGRQKMMTVPAEVIDDKMPDDWASRIKFREVEFNGVKMYQAYLKPRRKRGKVVQPSKKIILPPN